MANDFHGTYGTEGPLGFPMLDKQAQRLDAILKELPKSQEFAYRKAVFAKAPTEVNPGERSDVSWITTEMMDREQEVVIAKGMNDAHYAMNPIVTDSHSYASPPIGRSLWRKFVKDGATRGVKAKTQYPPRPAAYPPGDIWEPDRIFSLIQAGLLNGKSIGFLPIRSHRADVQEAVKNNWNEGTLVFDEWMLLEYAVCAMPMNQESVVENVSKALSSPAIPRVVKFTALEEIHKALAARVVAIDLLSMTNDIIDRMRGRV